MPASTTASRAASAKSSALVRSCLPNFVTPTPMTATRRIRTSWAERNVLSGSTLLRILPRRRGASQRGNLSCAAGARANVAARHRGGEPGVTMEDVLIVLLAVAAGLSLFVGLAQALDGRPQRVPLGRRAHALSPHHRPATTATPSPAPGPRGGRIFSDAAPATALRAAAVAEPEPVAAPEGEPVVLPEQMTMLEPVTARAAPEVASPAAVEPTPARPAPEQISLLEVETPARPAEPEPVAEKAETAAQALATVEAAEALGPAPAAADTEVPASAPVAAADLMGEAARLLKAGQYEALLA